MTAYEIEEVCQLRSKDARNHPILVQFAPGCRPPDETFVEAEEETHLSYASNPATSQVVLKAQVGKRAYLALEEEDGESGSQYVVAVVNKRRKTIKLVETAGEYLLRPAELLELINKPRDGAVAKAEEVSPEAKLHYSKQRYDLIEGFGSKRARRVQRRRQRNKESSTTVHKAEAELLELALDERLKAEEKPSKEFDDTSGSIVPPHNKNATTAFDAYPLEGLFDFRVLELLEEEANQVINWIKARDGTERPSYSPFAWSLVLNVVDSLNLNATEDESRRERKRVMAAIYLHYLAVLAVAPVRFSQREARTILEGTLAPHDIRDQLLVTFTEKSERPPGYRKTTERQDAIIYYAIILWLTASNFKAKNVQEFAHVFRLKLRDCLLQIKYLACTIKRVRKEGRDTYTVSLNVPLKFPVIRQRTRRPNAKRP